MDAIDFLKSQHREVEQLFSTLTFQKDEELQKIITERLKNHTKLEETHFYPAIESNDEVKHLVEHAEDEHAEVKKLLTSWDKVEDEKWYDVALAIVQSVTHHVREEEDVMFPAVRTAFKPEELQEIGSKMAQ